MSKIRIETLVLGSLSTNCYLISKEDGKDVLVVDPADNAEVIIRKLDSMDCRLAGILLTHGHFDHIGAAMELKRYYGAKIYANELEKEVLNNTYYNLSELMGERIFSMDADVYLRDGETLKLAGINITAVSTPGHTRGGMSYLMQYEEERALFSGDTLFQGSVGRYDFPTSSGVALFDSIRKKLLVLGDELQVYPGHGAATSIGEEKTRF